MTERQLNESLVGSTLGEYTRLTAYLGEGGMGAVFRGRQEPLNRDVCVKFLQRELVSDPESFQRFRREALVLSVLEHQRIVRLYSFGLLDEVFPYIVMEIAEGISLRRLLGERGALVREEACAIIATICDAMDYAHRQGVIHRDLKPDNILIVSDSEIKPEALKILDFGIAGLTAHRPAGYATLTATGDLMGSVHYMAPEVPKGGVLSPALDIYAIGIIFFELLTGSPPFMADNPVGLMFKHANAPLPPFPEPMSSSLISRELWRLIDRCCAKNPQHRFATCFDVKEELERIIALEDRELPPLRSSKPAWPLPLAGRGRPFLAAISVASLIVSGLLLHNPRYLWELEWLARYKGRVKPARVAEISRTLLETGRASDREHAEYLCRRVLKSCAANGPLLDEATAHAALARVLSRTGRLAEATSEASQVLKLCARNASFNPPEACRLAAGTVEVLLTPVLQEASDSARGSHSASWRGGCLFYAEPEMQREIAGLARELARACARAGVKEVDDFETLGFVALAASCDYRQALRRAIGQRIISEECEKGLCRIQQKRYERGLPTMPLFISLALREAQCGGDQRGKEACILGIRARPLLPLLGRSDLESEATFRITRELSLGDFQDTQAPYILTVLRDNTGFSWVDRYRAGIFLYLSGIEAQSGRLDSALACYRRFESALPESDASIRRMFVVEQPHFLRVIVEGLVQTKRVAEVEALLKNFDSYSSMYQRIIVPYLTDNGYHASAIRVAESSLKGLRARLSYWERTSKKGALNPAERNEAVNDMMLAVELSNTLHTIGRDREAWDIMRVVVNIFESAPESMNGQVLNAVLQAINHRFPTLMLSSRSARSVLSRIGSGETLLRCTVAYHLISLQRAKRDLASARSLSLELSGWLVADRQRPEPRLNEDETLVLALLPLEISGSRARPLYCCVSTFLKPREATTVRCLIEISDIVGEMEQGPSPAATGLRAARMHEHTRRLFDANSILGRARSLPVPWAGLGPAELPPEIMSLLDSGKFEELELVLVKAFRPLNRRPAYLAANRDERRELSVLLWRRGRLALAISDRLIQKGMLLRALGLDLRALVDLIWSLRLQDPK